MCEFGKALLQAVAAALMLLLLCEGAVRAVYWARNRLVGHIPLPYVIGQEYGPFPPWLDGLRILEPDPVLLWRNRPSVRRTYIDVFSPADNQETRRNLLRRFLPTVPEALRNNPIWRIELNSRGFRDVEFLPKDPDTFRVVCLGDSWTFGWNVGQEQSYPRRLQRLLAERVPRGRFEVFNLGVGGYSSYQGMQLLKQQALSLEPDLLVIGFAMNDGSVAGYEDKTLASDPPKEEPSQIFRFPAIQSEVYRLLRYLVLSLNHQPKSPAAHMEKRANDARKTEGVDEDEFVEWTRVTLPDFKSNVREMVRLARGNGAATILLYNEIWTDSPYRAALGDVAREEGVPLIDASALVAEARAHKEAELERRLNLRPPVSDHPRSRDFVDVVFRMHKAGYTAPRGFAIVGADPQLGGLIPNKARMRDDGTQGDQKAGDGVWSYTATFPLHARVPYMYTNGPREGVWEGLDVPHVRQLAVRAPNGGGKFYAPIDSFGTIYMQADSWHTNAEGYERIAEALLEVMNADPVCVEYIEAVTAEHSILGR